MRKATCFLLGCAVTMAATGCSLLLDLDPVNDNTSGAAGTGSGGGSGLGGKANGGTYSSGGKAGSVAIGGTDSSGGKAGSVSNGGVAGSVSTTNSAAGSTSLNGGTSGTTSAGTSGTGGQQAGAGGIVGVGATGGMAGGGGLGPSTSGGVTGNGGVAGAPGSIAGASNVAGAAGAAGMSAQGPMSCQKLATLCQGESCCTSITVPGGAFKMGRSTVSGSSDYYSDGLSYEVPEHDATVSSFALDKYEVTVGRFRSFVEAYNSWHKPPASNPQIGTGSNQNATASVRGRTGWQQNWTPNDNDLPADSAAVKTMLTAGQDQFSTWTETAGTNEAFPINNVSWTLAFAFCIWDGGRLPSEAEWEYAAVGGSANFLYPWGGNEPDSSRANFVLTFNSPKLAVGGRANGDGVFGHRDLSGSMNEWVFDWFSSLFYGTASGAPAACNNCVSVDGNDLRSVRGGGWSDITYKVRGAYRGNQNFRTALNNIGIRCARAAE